MKFSRLTVNNWRQFSSVDLIFHPRITIITGANGAGKTTLLRLLSQHFGWGLSLLATPRRRPGVSDFRYHVMQSDAAWAPGSSHSIGSIEYSDGSRSAMTVQSSQAAAYGVTIQNQHSVPGLYVGSHRPAQNYQPITAIPTTSIGAEQAYQMYFGELMQRFNNGYTQYSPIYRMKETLISMAMFGAGNQYVQKNEPLEVLFLRFKEILGQVLPQTIGFIDISVRIPDVVLVTKSGEFMIDSASGGLMSLIDLAWQIFLYSYNKNEFVVVLDEPENHLHPTMQRSIIGRLAAAFPHAQFIVATHSPFVVSSVKESYVHVLRYNSDLSDQAGAEFTSSKVSSVQLDLDTRAATANEILRDVLGVPVTLPQWAEEELEKITQRFSIAGLTSDGIAKLRSDLDEVGLSEYYSDALKIVAGKSK